jgi:hypothetical protein
LWEDREFFNASVKVNAPLTSANALKMEGFAFLLVTATVNAVKTMIMSWHWQKEGIESK